MWTGPEVKAFRFYILALQSVVLHLCNMTITLSPVLAYCKQRKYRGSSYDKY